MILIISYESYVYVEKNNYAVFPCSLRIHTKVGTIIRMSEQLHIIHYNGTNLKLRSIDLKQLGLELLFHVHNSPRETTSR